MFAPLLATPLLFAANNELEPVAQPAPIAAKAEYGDFWEALAAGKTWLRFLYRIEVVEEDASPEDAFASTLRTALGFSSPAYKGTSIFLEFEDVTVIGEENFRSPTNPLAGHPVVADPEGSDFNQAYLQWEESEAVRLRAGRQELVMADSRFVGNVGWRQNHQSFDSLSAQYSGKDWDFTYAYLFNAARITGDNSVVNDGDAPMNSHVLELARDFSGLGRARAFALLLDFDQLPAVSTTTYGLALKGAQSLTEKCDLLYDLQYAVQEDAADNPLDIDEDYVRAEIGGAYNGYALKIGSEVLGGSGGGSRFTTPLATLHKFNGYADVFLQTPDDGLEDVYVRVEGAFGDLKAHAVFHDFSTDTGGADLGTEFDLVATYPLSERAVLGFKLGAFDGSDGPLGDVSRAMAWIDLRAL